MAPRNWRYINTSCAARGQHVEYDPNRAARSQQHHRQAVAARTSYTRGPGRRPYGRSWWTGTIPQPEPELKPPRPHPAAAVAERAPGAVREQRGREDEV
ncbi:hypothetical protein SAMD00023353_0800520 [Rosellinia necatrix]|uniref:Uncharacterized protein n=1 Tax=Rosellinia necatrix TaxID=77044 RepID=A0A1S8A5Y8_ROSNE|nr:hypothetical protein SAMD00023353_0800520 [Rosellinia necatrix]